ncbi:MAG: hypothetical protein HY721_35425, partial [Planctomycetes bacterium]|nr:hypothetical protein [Planctomycetota bacterium]
MAAMAAAAAGDGSGADAEDRARIGKHGASIPLEGGWRRKKLTADFGEDQFVCDKRSFLTRYQLFLLARELEARLESRADLARALKEQTDGMLAGASLKPADVVLQKGGEALRASQELDAEYQGTKLRYRLEIVSRGGLSYLLTAWTARSHGAELTAALKKLAEGLQFPGEGSEWAKLLQPITKKVVRGGLEISFLFRPAIFAPDQETTEGIASLFSRDRDSAILIYDEPVGGGPDALLDEALESRRRKSPRARQVSRGDVQVGGAAGRKVVIDEEDLTLWVVALPAEPGRLLEIRYVSAGGADLPRTDRDLFFETFRLARPDDLEAFPEASAPPPSAPVDEHLARLLEGARFLGDTQVRKVHQALLAGERLLVAGSNEVKEISLQDGTARIAYRAEGSQDSITFAPWHDVLAVADDSGELLFVEEGEADPEPEPQDAEATFVAWAGPDRLLVLRKRTPARVAGLGALPWAPPDRLVVLEGPEEEERELREVHAPVRRLCANGAASAVLVATSPVDDPQREPTSLQVVPLGPGEGKDLDRWRWISFLGPAGDGWVVTGRREGLPRGVYWVQG